jgi:hypothetical protein
MAEFWLPAKPGVKVAIAILDAKFGFTVSDTMPKTRPPQIILVSHMGGSRPNPAQSIHRLLIECWANKFQFNLEEMCAEASAALRNSRGKSFADAFSFGWTNEQGPVDFPDPDVTDMSRWQFHGDLTLSTK